MDELLAQIKKVRMFLGLAPLNYDHRQMAINEAMTLCDMAEKELEAAHAMIHDLTAEKLDLCWQFIYVSSQEISRAIVGDERLRELIKIYWNRTSTDDFATLFTALWQAIIKFYLRQGKYISIKGISEGISIATRAMNLDREAARG